jgi:hypothetical protein
MSQRKKEEPGRTERLRKKLEDTHFTASIDNQDPEYNAKKQVLLPYIEAMEDVSEVPEAMPNKQRETCVKGRKDNPKRSTNKEALGPNIGR